MDRTAIERFSTNPIDCIEKRRFNGFRNCLSVPRNGALEQSGTEGVMTASSCRFYDTSIQRFSGRFLVAQDAWPGCTTNSGKCTHPCWLLEFAGLGTLAGRCNCNIFAYRAHFLQSLIMHRKPWFCLASANNPSLFHIRSDIF